MRPELTATLDGEELPVDRRRRADGRAGPGPQPHHAGHRRLHPGRAGPGHPRPRRLRHRGRGRPRHRQDRGRPAPRRLPALPGPAPLRGRHPDRLARRRCWSRTPRACCPRSARRARSPSARSARWSTAPRPPLYDAPAVARVKGSSRMLKVLRKAARGALELAAPRPRRRRADGRRAGRPALPGGPLHRARAERRRRCPHGRRTRSRPSGRPGRTARLRVVAFGRRLELEADELDAHPADRARRHRAGQPAAPARPQAAPGRPVGASPARPAGTPTRNWPPSCASSLRRGHHHRGRASSTSWTPGGRS